MPTFEILDNRSLHIRKRLKQRHRPDRHAAADQRFSGYRCCRIQYHQRRIQYHDHPLSGSVQPRTIFLFSSLSLGIAGHSHGSQINLPLFGSYNPTEGAKQYSLGKYQVSSMELQVSQRRRNDRCKMPGCFHRQRIVVYPFAAYGMNLRHFKIRHRVTQTQMAFFIAAVFSKHRNRFSHKKKTACRMIEALSLHHPVSAESLFMMKFYAFFCCIVDTLNK